MRTIGWKTERIAPGSSSARKSSAPIKWSIGRARGGLKRSGLRIRGHDAQPAGAARTARPARHHEIDVRALEHLVAQQAGGQRVELLAVVGDQLVRAPHRLV